MPQRLARRARCPRSASVSTTRPNASPRSHGVTAKSSIPAAPNADPMTGMQSGHDAERRRERSALPFAELVDCAGVVFAAVSHFSILPSGCGGGCPECKRELQDTLSRLTCRPMPRSSRSRDESAGRARRDGDRNGSRRSATMYLGTDGSLLRWLIAIAVNVGSRRPGVSGAAVTTGSRCRRAPSRSRHRSGSPRTRACRSGSRAVRTFPEPCRTW